VRRFPRELGCASALSRNHWTMRTRKASTVGTRNVVEPCLRAVESSASACSDPCHNGDHGCSAQTEEEIMSRCRAGNVAASVFVDIGSAVRCTGKTGRRPQIMG